VQPDRESKSSGSECTYEHDLTDLDRIRAEIDEMARDSARWLAKKQIFARTVVIKVRYDNFETITRSHSDAPTRDEDAIAARARALLARTEAGARAVRLLGASVHNLTDSDVVPARREDPRLPLPFDDPA
jgi:DNA polymerase IV